MLVQRLRARESQAARRPTKHCDSLEGPVREEPVEMRSATVAEAINPDAQTFERF
jgi:hypothetical protein